MERPHSTLPESSCCTEKNRKRKRNVQSLSSIETFRSSILRRKKALMPQMQLGKFSLQEIDDFSAHIMEIFEEDLILLQRKSGRKTLSVRDLETVLKLCFPNNLKARALQFAKISIDNCFRMNFETENSTIESDINIEKPIPESSIQKLINKSTDNSLEINMEFKNSTIESDIHIEEPIPGSSIQKLINKSTDNSLEINLEPKYSTIESDIHIEEPIPRSFTEKLINKSTDYSLEINLEPKNSTEECDMPIEESIPETSNKAKDKQKLKNKRNRKALNSVNFKTYILRKKKKLMPEFQMEKKSLQEMDDFLNHMMETFFEDIHMLRRKTAKKTLDINDLETVVRLCVPKNHAISVSKFAQTAVDSYLGQTLGKS